MQLHQLTKTTSKKKRVGRGGKRGTYSGRGNKGQKARAGNSMRPALRDIIKRFPKKRGYRNKSTQSTAEVTLAKLEAHYKDGDTVDLKSLRSKGLASLTDKRAKVIRTGELTKKITLDTDVIPTKGAQAVVEKAGGTVKQAARMADKTQEKQAKKPETQAVTQSKTKLPAKQQIKAIKKTETKKPAVKKEEK